MPAESRSYVLRRDNVVPYPVPHPFPLYLHSLFFHVLTSSFSFVFSFKSVSAFVRSSGRIQSTRSKRGEKERGTPRLRLQGKRSCSLRACSLRFFLARRGSDSLSRFEQICVKMGRTFGRLRRAHVAGRGGRKMHICMCVFCAYSSIYAYTRVSAIRALAL